MTVADTSRRAGPYEGNGSTKEFAFTFKIFKASDLFVAKSSDDGEVAMVLNTDYTVRLNANQDTTPGGTIVLPEPLADGIYLSAISQVDYSQLAVFTNKGGFYPETLNECYDKITILCQQLKELMGRAITTDITDTMSATELKQRLLDAAESATEIAKGYAQQAQASSESASASATLAEQWATKTDGKVQDIDYSAKHYALDARTTAAELPAKELELEAQLTAHTDTQIARIDDKTDSVLAVNATGCAEKTWTLTADVAANTEITIPGSIYYVVGRHHLRVGYNGLTCYVGTNFVEVGNTDTKSNIFKLTFDAKSGDELDVWVAALGKADVVDAINTAQAANDAVAELSQKVVYKDAESAGS